MDTPLSIEEPLEQFVKIYPNPFSERFFVEDYDQMVKEIKVEVKVIQEEEDEHFSIFKSKED